MKVYQAINAVQKELAAEGIAKSRKNLQQGFQYRGVDDVMNALAPLLAKHGLCVLPRVLTRECAERTTQKGSVLFYVTVDAEFDFVSSEDGSKHTVKTFGEAMDSADKATNKAMSVAYKYACIQAFAIPTEGDHETDAHTHEVAPAVDVDLLLKKAKEAASKGTDAYSKFWTESTPADRNLIGKSRHTDLKDIAAQADKAGAAA